MNHKTLSVITIFLLVTGCGGGENNTGPDLSYEGLGSAITIDENNAKELVIDSISNVEIGNSSIADNIDTDFNIGSKPIGKIMGKLRTLRAAEHGSVAETNSDITLNGMFTTQGSCGGEFVATTSGFPDFTSKDPVIRIQTLIELENATIKFETVFAEYCEIYDGQANTLNGRMLTQVKGNLREINASFFDFENRVGNTSTMINGVMNANYYTDADQEDEFSSDTTVSVVIDETIDEITTSVKLENFRILTKSDPDNSVIFEYSGRIYQSEMGYLDVSTPVGIKISASNLIPSEGELVFSGNGQVSVIFNSNQTYDLKITTAQGKTIIEKNISIFDFDQNFFELNIN